MYAYQMLFFYFYSSIFALKNMFLKKNKLQEWEHNRNNTRRSPSFKSQASDWVYLNCRPTMIGDRCQTLLGQNEQQLKWGSTKFSVSLPLGAIPNLTLASSIFSIEFSSDFFIIIVVSPIPWFEVLKSRSFTI